MNIYGPLRSVIAGCNCTRILSKFHVQKFFLKNLRLGMFLAMFIFFGHFSLDVLIKYVLNKKKV